MKKRPLRLLLQALAVATILPLVYLYQQPSEPSYQFHAEGGLTTYTTENQGDLTPLFLHAIGGAKHSIACLNYAIKDKAIIAALNNASKQGVDITVVYDPSASQGLDAILDQKIKRKYYEGKGLMHMKLLAIDKEIAYIGTANFTHSSLAQHANTVVRINHPGIASLIHEKTASYPKIISKEAQHFTLPGMEFAFSFLPDDPNASTTVTELLKNAQSTIDVAMFTFTRMDFAKELVAAHKRGVDVVVTLDEGSMKGTSKKIAAYLQKNGVEVKKGVADGLYHHKLALIDKKTWIIGSANWTKSAFGKNGEYMLVMERI